MKKAGKNKNHNRAVDAIEQDDIISRRQFIIGAGFLGICAATASAIKTCSVISSEPTYTPEAPEPTEETPATGEIDAIRTVEIQGQRVEYADRNGYPVLCRTMEFKPDSESSPTSEILNEISGTWSIPACGFLNVKASDSRVKIEKIGERIENESTYYTYLFSAQNWNTEDDILLKAIYDKSAINNSPGPKYLFPDDNPNNDVLFDINEFITNRDDILDDPKHQEGLAIIYNDIVGQANSISEAIQNLGEYLEPHESGNTTGQQRPLATKDVEIICNSKTKVACTGYIISGYSVTEKYCMANRKPDGWVPLLRVVKTQGDDGSSHVEMEIETDDNTFLRIDPQTVILHKDNVLRPTDFPLMDLSSSSFAYSNSGNFWYLLQGSGGTELLDDKQDFIK